MFPNEDRSKQTHIEDKEQMRFSRLIDAYRKDTVKYLAKISKQARDDFKNAIAHAARVKTLREGDNHSVQDESGDKASCDIQAYLERLERIFKHPKPSVRIELIRRFKENALYPFFLIDPKYFNEEYIRQRTEESARNRGIEAVEITEEEIQRELEATRERQRISLDRWVDYLASDDCKYPSDIKYFAMQGVLARGTLREGTVRKRSRSTTAEFPALDSQALSMALGALEAVYYEKDTSTYDSEILELIKSKESFGDIYAYAVKGIEEKAGEKPLEITDGEWIRFEKGSDPVQLVERINTGNYRHYLCIGDIGSATQYLKKGAVEVYFSNNRNGQPVVPRAALAISEEAGLYEVRGTWDKDENIDPEILRTDILQKRCQDMPNGESYLRKDTHMRRLTKICDKCFVVAEKGTEPIYLAPEFTKDDLLFLYEIDSAIEGFGYSKDPRIAEIRSKRKPEKDMLTIFECTEDQIAGSKDEIDVNTKAYLGKLEPGVFEKLHQFNIEHIYTSFPEGHIRFESLEIGGMTADELGQALEDVGIKTSTYSKSILRNKEQFIGPVDKRNNGLKGSKETLDLVRLHVRDLGFTSNPTTTELFKRAQELGLELCPPETGPYKRLADKDQPLGDRYYIGMEPVVDSDGRPRVFYCSCYGGGLWLGDSWAGPGDRWDLDYGIVFRYRHSISLRTGKSDS